MKKIIFSFITVFYALGLFAQNAMDSLAMQFQSMMQGTTYGKNKEAGKYYNIRGFKMYAETYGSGQPLLIIHGNGGSINNFLYQIPYFSKKYKVIVADSRAQGNSTDEADSLSYEMMADDYAALLDQMKIESAFVIGWSDGGINGLLLAIRHPGLLQDPADPHRGRPALRPGGRQGLASRGAGQQGHGRALLAG